MLKFGVFGYGMIADVHVEGLAHIEGVEVVAVCGPREAGVRGFADKFGIENVFTNPDHLLALDELDGVLVDTPDVFHHDLVVRSARGGQAHLLREALGGHRRRGAGNVRSREGGESPHGRGVFQIAGIRPPTTSAS